MASIRRELIGDVLDRGFRSSDFNIYINEEKWHESMQQIIYADEYLTNEEISEAIRKLKLFYDHRRCLHFRTKRVCEHCKQECLATYCEQCLRSYLKSKFSNWTSGNNEIDNLIKRSQMETISHYKIVEWIPYNKLQNIEYLTKGGISEIYTADWIDGFYDEWDSKKQRLTRFGRLKVVLKKLVNVKNANRSWFDEAEIQIRLSSKCKYFTRCYGLTQNLQNEDYFLVMCVANTDLRKYLQQYQITWKQRIDIILNINEAFFRLYTESLIHRDLHSGNILYCQYFSFWTISDFGFCGPVNKPLESIYGNLPYIAPEVIIGRGHTFASDIYSIGMIMWEISSGQPPFANFDHDYDLAMKIVNGMRPKIVPDTPLEYKNLMEQCWNADPLKRPNNDILYNKIKKMQSFHYQNKNDKSDSIQSNTNSIISSTSINPLISKLSNIYTFKDLPEPRNATTDYDSKQMNLNIPDKISKDYTELDISTKIVDIDICKSKRNNLYNNNGINYISDEIEKHYVQKCYKLSNDDEEMYNNSNLHSEDQDDLEIPEEILKE